MKTPGSKFIICFSLSLCIGVQLSSCTPSKRLTLNGEKEYLIQSECGNMILRCYWAYHMLYMEHHLNGTFTVHPDSLKFGFHPNPVETKSISFYVDKKELPTDQITHIENDLLLIKYIGEFNTLSRDGTKKVFILPSNYIMCGDKPLIKDTITIN